MNSPRRYTQAARRATGRESHHLLVRYQLLSPKSKMTSCDSFRRKMKSSKAFHFRAVVVGLLVGRLDWRPWLADSGVEHPVLAE